MAKGNRILIGLVCSQCHNRNYVTEKNKINLPEKLKIQKYCSHCRNLPEKLKIQKYCSHCRKRTEHKETGKLS